jgi:hypothetical protein
MLAVTPEFINQMVGGPQDRWQDQVLEGANRVWLAEPADDLSRRKEWKIEYTVILGWDDMPVHLYQLMNPTWLRHPWMGPTPEHVL